MKKLKLGGIAGEKWCAGHDAVCHAGSGSLDADPLSSPADSAKHSARAASAEAMLSAVGAGLLSSRRPRRSIDCVRLVKMASRGGMWMGSRGEMVSCCGGSVRS